MARDRSKLYVTVPAPFRCPISMDVMKSPVSLCTGVTYDRSSIQAWLETGHNTCPATMQVLHSTDFVPNLTLRSLIRHWSDSLRLQPPDFAASSSQLVSKQEVTYSIKNIDKETTQKSLKCLSQIANFARYSDENREFLASNDDFVPAMVGILRNVGAIEILESAVSVLDLVLSEVRIKNELRGLVFERNSDCLSPIITVLQKGRTDSKIASSRILESIASDPQSQRSIVEKQGLLHELYRLVETESDQRAIEAGLSCLIAVSTSRPVKKELVRFGISRTAGNILSNSDAAAPVIEKALKLLEAISTCEEGRAAIGEAQNCVEAIVQRLMKKSSAQATENGVAVLWRVCYLSRHQAAQEAATRNNAMAKVLLVMQSSCSGGAYQMCKDLVKVLRVNTKSSLASYQTKTTHIKPY